MLFIGTVLATIFAGPLGGVAFFACYLIFKPRNRD